MKLEAIEEFKELVYRCSQDMTYIPAEEITVVQFYRWLKSIGGN